MAASRSKSFGNLFSISVATFVTTSSGVKTFLPSPSSPADEELVSLIKKGGI